MPSSLCVQLYIVVRVCKQSVIEVNRSFVNVSSRFFSGSHFVTVSGL